MDRLHGMEQAAPVRDVEYLESLADAVDEGVRYGIELLAVGEERAGDVPLAVLAQARLAARLRIPLETVLLRHFAAKTRLTDFVLEEAAGAAGCDAPLLRGALGDQGAAFESLVALATEEYRREAQARPASHEARLVERVQRLLAGELVDPSLLEYELGGHHLGLVACSVEARPLIRRLAGELGCRSLVLAPASGELWAWLGSTREPIDPVAVRGWLGDNGSADLPIGMGEPKCGCGGWRLTHRQARASIWIAEARPAPVVEYPEAALLTSMGGDAVLTTSLREKYLLPLAEERDGGEVLRTTLRAYFRADRNSSSAGAALGVSRQTVANRIATAERRIGQRLNECAEALYAALCLEELGRVSGLPDSLP
jgi:hypothetical protein